MNLSLVERIVNAVLYEGYMLYPYRPSAVKNQQRWNFGALYPRAYSEAQTGADAWTMQTECLVSGDARTTIEVKTRFLHLVAREVGQLTTPLPELAETGEPDFHVVASMEAGGQVYQTWQEAIERDVSAPGFALSELVSEPRELPFTFANTRALEPLREADGLVVGLLIRQQQTIKGAIEVQAEALGERLFKLTTRILNLTGFEGMQSRDDALMRAMVSTHTILSVKGGEFVSLLDPPEAFREAAASCSNKGTYPVLVGADGERDCMLSSPIILYDYPQIAPESAGDLFDATEIDEILTLRIMTLTDEEKREMRSGDERARQILERTEAMPEEQLMKLHGALRGLRPTVEKK